LKLLRLLLALLLVVAKETGAGAGTEEGEGGEEEGRNEPTFGSIPTRDSVEVLGLLLLLLLGPLTLPLLLVVVVVAAVGAREGKYEAGKGWEAAEDPKGEEP
jgi:hypothetical protein